MKESWEKKQRFNTYIALQASYASVELCATDRASIQPRPQPKSVLIDFGLQQNSHM